MKKRKEDKISFSSIKDIIKNTFRLGRMFWKEKGGAGIIIAMALIVFGTSFSPFLLSASRGFLINELVEIGQGEGIVYRFITIAVVVYILVGFLTMIFYALRDYFERLFGFLVGEKLELSIAKKKGEIDVAVHEDPKHNDLFNKISENGIWRAENFMRRQFWVIQDVVRIITASLIIFSYAWWVFFIIFVGTIPRLLAEMKYGGRVYNIHTSKSEARRHFWESRGKLYGISSITELKLFQNVNYFLSIMRKLFRSFKKEEKKADRKRLVWELLSISLSQITFAVAVVWFVYEIINGQLLIGTFTFVLASVGGLGDSLSSMFYKLGVQYQDNLFVSDLFKFFDIKPVVKKAKRAIKLDYSKTPEIIFDDVSFSYPGTKKTVLKDLNLKISSGERVAVIGINGAGKTTLVKLLCRFYDPTKGKITIGGYDLKEIDLESWYSHLGAIFQDYNNYHFVVKEAIAIGRISKKTSTEKVKDAAKAAEADIFIEEWENSYKQMLGKQFKSGVEPSIGQWQKLALARVFYRDPRVLVLDEPTASIDAEAEEKIFRKINSLPSDRTIILISHRFSTVRQANKIVVIEKGGIKELGTHEELIKQNGTYAKLFKLQAKGYR